MGYAVHVRNADRMMVSATAQEEGVEVQFADGLKGVIPFGDIEQIKGTPDLTDIELPNPYEMLLRNKQGIEVDIGWDFARHYCDPSYRGKIEKVAATAGQSLGSRVRHLREAAGWTQAKLAENAGIARVTLNRIENGEQTPRYENLRAISKALGLPFVELVTEA